VCRGLTTRSSLRGFTVTSERSMAQWPVTVKNDDGGGKEGAFGHQGLTGGGGETQSA